MVHSYRKIILKDLKNRFASLYICVVKCAIAIFAHDLSLNFCEMERAHHKSSFVRQHLYQIQNITTYIFLNSSILIQKDLKHFVISKVWLDTIPLTTGRMFGWLFLSVVVLKHIISKRNEPLPWYKITIKITSVLPNRHVSFVHKECKGIWNKKC